MKLISIDNNNVVNIESNTNIKGDLLTNNINLSNLFTNNGIASLGTIGVKNSYTTPTQYIQFGRDIAYTQNGNDGNNGNGYRFDGQNTTGHFTFKGYNNFVLEQPLNMNSTNKIINVANPTNPQDAATKKYTDDQLATKANLSGATFTGNIVMGSNYISSTAVPQNINDLTNKQYVDNNFYTKSQIHNLLTDLLTSNPSLTKPSNWNW